VVGAPHLAAGGGKAYWELRVVSPGRGLSGFRVGLAGTGFLSGPQAPVTIGRDEASWSLDSVGKRSHRFIHFSLTAQHSESTKANRRPPARVRRVAFAHTCGPVFP
jgi:hypothetical protein